METLNDTNRETVAFDIDDVLLDTAPSILTHYRETYGISIPVEHFYSKEPHIWGVDDYSETTRRVGSYLASAAFAALEPRPEAVEAVQALAETKRLVAVTGRSSAQYEQTKDWLDKHFGVFESLRCTDHFNEKAVTKGDVCAELGADWLVDDHLAHLMTLGAYGVRGILFGGLPWGQGHELPSGVYRADTWRDVNKLLETVRE